jgi:hypothetical protein
MGRTTRNRLSTTSVMVCLVWLSATTALAQKVPTPESVLGFKVGADFHLASYQQAYAYFKALEQASPLIKVVEAGKTAMGKPQIYAVITSAANMAKLSRYQEISKTLSLAKGLTDAQARALAAEGKAVVYIDGGLHATECAPAQHNIQLAYDMVTGEDAATKQIRDNVILVLLFANPDGMDTLAEWYHPNIGTPYEVSPMPWVYNKYVGHDNNRDSYMLNMPETQNITRVVNQEWYPQILYNHHQTAPFPARIWIHPASEPTNPNVHPLLIRWQNLLGTAMGAAFDRANQPGAISRTVFDTWYPGYVTQVVDAHNIISLLTETALYRYATPHFYTLDDFPEADRDFTMSVFYPSPWKGGWWRLGDAVAYCLTASKAVLQTAAVYRQELLYDKYQMGRDTMARFQKEPPYAWIVPQDQWDAPTAAVLLSKLHLLGIDVSKADQPFVSDGISYPAGTWVIPMTQPFALFAKNLLEEQTYPDLTKYPDAWEGLVSPQKFKDAYLPPYDMAGWTLSYQMGVKVVAANTPLTAALTPLDTIAPPAGKVEGAAGATYLISPKTNNSFIAINRILKQGGELSRTQEALTLDGKSFPPGTYVVPAKALSAATAETLAKELALTITGTSKPLTVKTARLKAPRDALYKSWTAQMDEGWTRWLFEQFEFPFTNIQDPEIKAGELRQRFDVLVIPSMSTEAIVGGHRLGAEPLQYVGGITDAGVRNIRQFVEDGGTLVLLNNATLFGLEKLGLPVTDVLKDLKAPRRAEGAEAKPVEFACPGSVIRMQFDTKHPVAYGMPEEAPGMFISSPAFRMAASFDGQKAPATIAKYPGSNLLMSGYLKGEKYLQNTVAAADVSLGKGRVVLLGFGVEQRGQPHGTFKLLFNSLYYGSQESPAAPSPKTAPAAPAAKATN